MTEEEWLTSREPERLLAHLETSVSLRKARLFGVACCRRVLHLNFVQVVPLALEVVEDFADGMTSESEHRAATDAIYNTREFAGRAYLSDPDNPNPHDGTAAYCLLDAMFDLFRKEECCSGFPARHCAEAVWFADRTPERKSNVVEAVAQTALVRDIFGNPFRPVAFDPAWRTDTAVSLARGMYDSRDFGAMPILADAFQDAGCEDEQVLHHCRDATAPHVRGCWVCDLVLSKQ
jgi:hypothetical protein